MGYSDFGIINKGEGMHDDETIVTPQAARALKEAEERRKKAEQDEHENAVEIDGRDGPDPVRYGDWEKDGIASDF